MVTSCIIAARNSGTERRKIRKIDSLLGLGNYKIARRMNYISIHQPIISNSEEVTQIQINWNICLVFYEVASLLLQTDVFG